jgi:hypothetical protein
MTEVARRLQESKDAQAVIRELDGVELTQMSLARLLRACDTLNANVEWFVAYIAAEIAIEKAAKAKA